MKYFKLLLPPAVLAAIIAYCFGRSLGSYFLEDDFGEVCYVSKIFEGNIGLLWSNFTGNYMQIPTMNVYRPGLLMSLVYDYAFWKTNAFGYYLTNILFMFGAGIMFFLVLRQLTRSWGEFKSYYASLCSAALFVSNPLHSEAVSLVVGRVDIICSFFYLLSFWCFLKSGRPGKIILGIAGVVSFFCAMLTKEMAIGLPPLLTATAFIFPEFFENPQVPIGPSSIYSFRTRLVTAFKASMWLWASTVIYFIIRYLALGTLTGGYVGSVGGSLFSHIFDKWRDIDTVVRLFYPLNLDVFSKGQNFRNVYSLLYFVFAALIFTRCVLRGIPKRWLAFLAVWIFTTLIPIYQLWGLGYNLEGSRFVFFLTMPLMAFVPILLFVPVTQSGSVEYAPKVSTRLSSVALASFAVFVLFSAVVAYRNNIPWLHAGKQTRAFQQQALLLAHQIPTGHKAAIIGIPKERGGAHMVLNGITFDIMLSPPYSNVALDDKFVTFDPILFGRSNLINPQRLKQCLIDPAIDGLYVWNNDNLCFKPVPFSKSDLSQPAEALPISLPATAATVLPYTEGTGRWELKDNELSIENAEKEISLAFNTDNLNPFKYDFVEFEFKREPPGEQHAFAYWNPAEETNKWLDIESPSESLLRTSDLETYQPARIALSNHWSWFANGAIGGVQVKLPASASSISIRKMRLISCTEIAPSIDIEGLQASNIGVYSSFGSLRVKVDTSGIRDCHGIELQITKPNYFFENFSEEEVAQALLKFIKKTSVEPVFELPESTFVSSGYYQLRAVALDENGKEMGEPSGPVTIYRSANRLAGVSGGAGG
jgi:hypothetical protein